MKQSLVKLIPSRLRAATSVISFSSIALSLLMTIHLGVAVGQPTSSAIQLAQNAPTAEQLTTQANADAVRQKAIADFTAKMKAANYPALFDKAAAEFNVPPDVLKGVAFAETRWDQLQWPPGETASPENGMPHAYGIMSLMDNDYFGHSLLEAAKLIGQDPDVLKTDAYQNMRGGAALLQKLYAETPKPADAPGDEIESWRKAIVKYCGIPQPELSESHALKVYEFMNMGYHQYGLEWDAHPVNLGPMRAEVARIKAEAQARLKAKMTADGDNGKAATVSAPSVQLPAQALAPAPAAQAKPAIPAMPVNGAVNSEEITQRWLLLGLIAALIAIGVFYVRSRGRKPPEN